MKGSKKDFSNKYFENDFFKNTFQIDWLFKQDPSNSVFACCEGGPSDKTSSQLWTI